MFIKLKYSKNLIVISQFENLLKGKSIHNLKQDSKFKPLSINELNDRIDKSESDFLNNRYKNTNELFKKYN